MKLLLNGDQELANLDLDVDTATDVCNPRVEALGYRIEGPATKAALVKDEATDGLRLALELPGVAEVALVIEKTDVKKLKGLMNKDAIKFLVKALV